MPEEILSELNLNTVDVPVQVRRPSPSSESYTISYDTTANNSVWFSDYSFEGPSINIAPSPIRECYNCGLDLGNDPQVIDGITVCNDCYTKHTIICDICGNLMLTNNAYLGINGEHICKKCTHNNHMRSCSYCGGYFTPVNQNSNDAILCPKCRINVRICVSCGRSFHIADSNDPEHSYCNRCFNSRCGLHTFDFKPIAQYHGGDEPFHLGVELETEIDRSLDRNNYARKVTAALSNNEELFYIKHDGSIAWGIELVSHPCTLKFHKEEFPWKKILTSLKKDNCYSNNSDTCGLHIHASKSIIKPTDYHKLSLFVHNQVDKIEVVARRRGCNHAKFKSIIPVKQLFKSLNKDRYEAINFLNRNTVEFRMFKGTLSLNTLMASLEFVHSVCLFVQTEKMSNLIRPNDTAWNNYLEYLTSRPEQYEVCINYFKDKELL